MNEKKEPKYRRYALVLSIGYYLTGSIVGGILSGVFLDRWLNTKPIFTLILLILGIGYGLYMTIRISMRLIE